jgi:hypothetical protein
MTEIRFIINHINDDFYYYLKHLLHLLHSRKYAGFSFSYS